MKQKKAPVPQDISLAQPVTHAVTTSPPLTTAPVAQHRVSWAAIFAGVTVALVTQPLLGVLGIAIGASTIDPLHQQDSTGGLGNGAGVWFVVTGLPSLFAGGWTAGRLAGIPRTVDSSLHGVVTWGLATLFTFYLLTTGVGAIIGGAARALGQGASLVGQGVASASPQVGDAIRGQLKEQGVDWDSIQQDASNLMRQTGKPELQLDALNKKVDDATKDAQNTAGGTAENPQAADQQLTGLLDRLFNQAAGTVNAADREAVVNVVAARTGQSKKDAGKIVDRWRPEPVVFTKKNIDQGLIDLYSTFGSHQNLISPHIRSLPIISGRPSSSKEGKAAARLHTSQDGSEGLAPVAHPATIEWGGPRPRRFQGRMRSQHMMILGAGGSVGALAVRAVALSVVLVSPAVAGFVTLSPTGTTGPGGTITFAEIGPFDPTSANVNTDFRSVGTIGVDFSVSDGTPIALYGAAVNDSSQAWMSFSARVTVGSATFQDPNDIYNPYGTSTDSMGWSVTRSHGGTEADFSGGAVGSGDSLDLVLGMIVANPSQPLTVVLAPGASVPEPASWVLGLLAAATGGLGWRYRRVGRRVAAWGLLVGAGLAAPPLSSATGPAIAPAYAGRFAMSPLGVAGGLPTQMTVGPDGRLYLMTIDTGPISYAIDPATGALANPVAVNTRIKGLGIGFHGTDLYLSSNDGTIHKLKDGNGNGIYGEAGEFDVAIVTGIPQGDHNIDQIQIAGDTLYTGVGRRTINGRAGAWTSGQLDDLGGQGCFNGGLGRTYGDSAYNGTIAWIQNLKAVVDQTGSANAWASGSTTITRALIQGDAGPFQSTDPSKLVVHSAGVRNPFGLCLDPSGTLWFTNNFNRTPTLGNGQAGFGSRGDQLNSDFSVDVHDQLFKASPGADYGYYDTNWRNVNPMMTPTAPGYHLVRSTTFDNSYNKGPYTMHNPAQPDGMGPSASADGCAFASYSTLPAELKGNIFIVRYNGTITEAPGGLQRSLTYNDLVAVDPATGKVRQIASGFNGPLAILSDDLRNRLIVTNLGDKMVYAIQSLGP